MVILLFFHIINPKTSKIWKGCGKNAMLMKIEIGLRVERERVREREGWWGQREV